MAQSLRITLLRTASRKAVSGTGQVSTCCKASRVIHALRYRACSTSMV